MSVHDEDTTALPSSRPLKRSASTISLPTPPQTQRRRKNAKSKRTGSFSSDEDDTDVGEEPVRGRALKRTRIAKVTEEEDQDAFWASDGDKSKSSVSEPEPVLEGNDSDSETTSFLARRRMKQKSKSTTDTASAPVSPPPSNRRPRGAKVAVLKTTEKSEVLGSVTEEEEEAEQATSDMVISPAAVVSATPATPKTPKGQIRSAFSPMLVVRDSPDNPFLSSPGSPSATATSARLDGSGDKGRVLEEKPTIQMVFRGVRKTFPNPYYDHERGRPKSPSPNSLLPPEHPDYSPDLRGHARNLWPAKREEPKTPTKPKASPSKTAGSSATMLNTPPMTMKRSAKSKGKTLSLVDSDDENEEGDLDDDDVLPVRPLRLFA